MKIIKFRISSIKACRSNGLPSNYSFFNNVEFCVLQIRKILELIAHSSLISDAEIYRQQLGKIEKMWNAKLILKDLERIHKDFYPQPVSLDPDDEVYERLVDKTEPFLTRDEFVKVYDKCGKMLHEFSPLEANETIENEFSVVWDSIDEWVEHIVQLLSQHIICLYNEHLFYIKLGDSDTEPTGRLMQKESAN
ncbi:MAG: hypothetical protein IJG48_01925 [Mogibacterium sp.]|nr:hypothetical protein [Mogibacterium sp.]